MQGLGETFLIEEIPLLPQALVEIIDGHFPDEFSVKHQAILGGDENQLGGLECFGNRQGDGVGVDSKSAPFTVIPQRLDDGDDSLK